MGCPLPLLRSLQFTNPVKVRQPLSKPPCIIIRLPEPFRDHGTRLEGGTQLQVRIFDLFPVILDPKVVELFQCIQLEGVSDEFLGCGYVTPRPLPSLVQSSLLALQSLHSLLVQLFMGCELGPRVICLCFQLLYRLAWWFCGGLGRWVSGGLNQVLDFRRGCQWV